MSARGYNKVIEVGNLTADPEMKTTSSGTAFTTFRLAVTRAYANNGQTQVEYMQSYLISG